MATHSSVLAWRIPWTEEPSRRATVHRVAKSQTLLKQLNIHTQLSLLFIISVPQRAEAGWEN